MTPKSLVLLLSGALALTACNPNSATENGNATAASQTASASAASSAAPAAPATSELKSRDGKLSVQALGNFTDKGEDANARPAGVSAEQLILLQYNENDNVTVYAANFGKAKHKAADYFAKLKKAIESDKALKDVSIDEATENRMAYRFTQTGKEGEVPLHESCVALVEAEQVYSVCATSPEISGDDLAGILKEIKVQSASQSASEVAASAVTASAASAASATK